MIDELLSAGNAINEVFLFLSAKGTSILTVILPSQSCHIVAITLSLLPPNYQDMVMKRMQKMEII
jgi:hypothetical protein